MSDENEMTYCDFDVRDNIGNGRTLVRLFSHQSVPEGEINKMRKMTRNQAINYGKINQWKIVDLSEFVDE